MNYDKESFLAGIAVGRQLKGWATAAGRGIAGVIRYGTGEKELVNIQSATESNYVLVEPGVRYTSIFTGVEMYTFAAAPREFTFRNFSNDREEHIESGRIMYYGVEYHYAWGYWYSPVPTPTIVCNPPAVIKPGQNRLTTDMLVTQGMLLLNY